ncbi:MAG: hypothetical protein NC397_08385 [Clostridium sp.]|nr:hypothetical protein [Clostridium sp.]
MILGKKINVKAVLSVFALCLIIIALILLFYNHTYNKLSNDIQAVLESVSIIDAETAEKYHSEQYTSSSKTQKAFEDNQEYYIVVCDFYVDYSENDSAIVSKAVAESDRFSLIYNDKKYNVCESPITMEKGNKYNYELLLFIEKDAYTKQLSQDEFMLNLSESLNIYLR